MRFLVEWQELVYDNFDKLKVVHNKPLFEIQTNSLERGREIAETIVNKIIIGKQAVRQSRDILIAKVTALIDEAGIRHQLPER